MTTAIDPKDRFSSRVDAYVAARPHYPRKIIDLLRREIGLEPTWKIIDVGSGTGISCELFLQNGNPVTGVEPNAAMRAAAEQSLRGFRNFTSVPGSADATTLPDACVDLIVAAQAFHWFDIPSTRREFQRILRPGGWVLLIWNTRKTTGNPFLEDYEQLLLTFGTDYKKVRHENIQDAELRAFFDSTDYRSATLPNFQHLNFEGLRSRLLSSSYVPQQDDPRSLPMLAALCELFDRHAESGQVTIEYETELFWGRLT